MCLSACEGRRAKLLNISITEGVVTLKPSFAYHNLHPIWCFQLQEGAKIGIFQVH